MAPLMLALFATACAPAVDPLEEVAAQGDFAVGYRNGSLTYRPEGEGADRTLPVEVWYPAETGSNTAIYEVNGIVEKASAYAFDNATAAEGTFPVAIYSHGSGGLGLLAYPYAERLASHGWIVVAPDHVGNTSRDTLAGTETSLLRNMLNRPADVTAALDTLEDGTFAVGTPDLERVLLFGHSFGAWTTLATAGGNLDLSEWASGCENSSEPDCTLLADPEVRARLETDHTDARIDVIAPQAPAFSAQFATDTLANLGKPTLLMSGELDVTTPHATEAVPTWDSLAHPDDHWINLPSGGHYSFITVCDDVGIDLITAFDPSVLDDGCGPEAPAPTEIVGHLATYLLAFAGGHLDDRTDWLEVLERPLSADVALQARGNP
jgi:predicted dienelactone hydrolase